MTEEQAEQLLITLERIAEALERSAISLDWVDGSLRRDASWR